MIWLRDRQSQRLRAAAIAALALCGVPAADLEGQSEPGPNVLLVVAHPDDDAMFTGAVYKITHQLGGNVDLALVTDGSGGYRYAQLAEPIYGLDLTNEAVARQHLPAIRKQELMAGGRIQGIRNYFFLDQFDHQYTENIDTVLTHVWDADWARERLTQIMTRVTYDYVLVHLPIEGFHAHHKGASILALEAAQRTSTDQRPVVLGGFVGSKSEPLDMGFTEHPGYPITRVRTDVAPFVFDRTEKLSEDGRLDYRIIANWVIAEHKTQGTMQLLVNRGDIERYWYFTANDPERFEETKAFFALLGRD